MKIPTKIKIQYYPQHYQVILFWYVDGHPGIKGIAEWKNLTPKKRLPKIKYYLGQSL